MDQLLVAAQGVAPPVVAAFVLVGGLGRRWVSLAIALGLLVAYVLVKEWPALPGSTGIDGTQWILWFVVAAALVATVDDFGAVPRRVASVLGLALLAVQPWFVLALMRRGWSDTQAALHVSALAVASVALALELQKVVARRPGLVVPIVWTCALAVDAFVLLQAGTALLGQLAGAVAAALGAATFTSIWKRDFTLGRAHAVTLVAAHAGLLFAGHHFTYAPNLVALLAAALAPVGLSLGAPAARRNWPGVAVSFAAMAVAFIAAASSGSGKDY